MKIDRIILKNFRGFAGEHHISVDRLTAFVGRNDAGKSSILDGLGAFFEHPLCKPDTSDVCVFVEAPGELLHVGAGCHFGKEVLADHPGGTKSGQARLGAIEGQDSTRTVETNRTEREIIEVVGLHSG